MVNIYKTGPRIAEVRRAVHIILFTRFRQKEVYSLEVEPILVLTFLILNCNNQAISSTSEKRNGKDSHGPLMNTNLTVCDPRVNIMPIKRIQICLVVYNEVLIWFTVYCLCLYIYIYIHL